MQKRPEPSEPSFLSGVPAGCPGKEAQATFGTFYRACKSNPPTEEDFTSHAHSKLAWKKKRAKPNVCSHWGLSGWISSEDVRHALALHDWLKNQQIFSVEFTPVDGRIAQTGEPPHHTFWPYDGVDLVSRSKSVKI